MPIVKEVIVEAGSTGQYFRVKVVHDDGSVEVHPDPFNDKEAAISFARKKADEYGVGYSF